MTCNFCGAQLANLDVARVHLAACPKRMVREIHMPEADGGGVVRYAPGIGDKQGAIKAALDGSYRFVMLAMMAVEIGLLVTLVVLEALHR